MDFVKVCKVLHIFSLIVWLGLLVALPQMVLIARESLSLACRLYYRLQLPCMIVALASGLILYLLQPAAPKAGWFHMKMTGMAGLVLLDYLMRQEVKKQQVHTSKWIIFQIGVVCLVLLALISIYIVRNKEGEWQKAYSEREKLQVLK